MTTEHHRVRDLRPRVVPDECRKMRSGGGPGAMWRSRGVRRGRPKRVHETASSWLHLHVDGLLRDVAATQDRDAIR